MGTACEVWRLVVMLCGETYLTRGEGDVAFKRCDKQPACFMLGMFPRRWTDKCLRQDG